MTTLDARQEEQGDGAHGGRPILSDGTSASGSHVVSLTQPTASLRPLTGSKAAHLARAARAGLPVLPGFVLPPGFAAPPGPRARHGPRPAPEDIGASRAVAQAWAELSRPCRPASALLRKDSS